MTLFSARPAARSNNKAARLLVIVLLSVAATAKSEPLSIAVASNFRFTLEALLSEGIKAEPASYRVSAAASGLLYAQIVNGARFHLFFSADSERPRRLMQDALIVPGSRRTYAMGQLAFWMPDRTAGWQVALAKFEGIVAIANPLHAPYGQAAKALIDNQWLPSTHTIVLAPNVGVAYQYAFSRTAKAAFISHAQAIAGGLPLEDFVVVNESVHAPIVQQRVVLSDHPLGDDLLHYIDSEAGRSHLKRLGYLPAPKSAERAL